MSFNNPKTSQRLAMRFSQRDSVSSSCGSYGGMRLSTDSSFSQTSVTAEMNNKFADLDSLNLKIKKCILQYADLDGQQRTNVRKMLKDALALADEVQKVVQAIDLPDWRERQEKILTKKCKELAVLGTSLVYKEKEVLLSYRQRLEQTKADKNPRGYEKKALLEETDSDEDTFKQEDNEEKEQIMTNKYDEHLL